MKLGKVVALAKELAVDRWEDLDVIICASSDGGMHWTTSDKLRVYVVAHHNEIRLEDTSGCW